MLHRLALASSHLLVLAAGFGLGLYFLPILAAPESPSQALLQATAEGATYTARFRRDVKGSDLMHWGEGQVAVGPDAVALMGRLAPGPSYRLYLTREPVETAAEFLRVKASAVMVGDIKTFDNFVLPLPPGVDLSAHAGLVVWCESFQRFITAARYR